MEIFIMICKIMGVICVLCMALVALFVVGIAVLASRLACRRIDDEEIAELEEEKDKR